MFGFLKKRHKNPSADDLSRLSEMACDEVREKWLYFNKVLQFKADVSLAEQIDIFSKPLSEFFQQKYPALLLGGSEIFWLSTFTAILESGTHPKDEVNAAVAQLQQKYGGKQ